MWILVPAIAAACGVSLYAGSQQSDAAGVLAQAQSALGGARVRAVESLLLQGEARALNLADGAMGAPRAVEIRLVIPTRYLRIEYDSGAERRAGFSNGQLLNALIPLKPDVQVVESYPPDQIDRERRNYAWLLAGMLGRVDVLPGLVVKPVSEDSVTIEMLGWPSARLELDTATHVPVRLRYQGNVALPSKPGEGVSGPPARVSGEVVIEYLDRRMVAGVSVPHRVKTGAKGYVLSELVLDTIRVNPPLTAKDFNK